MTSKKIERCKRALLRHQINVAAHLAAGNQDKAQKAAKALTGTANNLRAAGVQVG